MAQQDVLVYLELSVASAGLLPTLHQVAETHDAVQRSLFEQCQECLKMGLFAPAPSWFAVVNDHGSSTVSLC